MNALELFDILLVILGGIGMAEMLKGGTPTYPFMKKPGKSKARPLVHGATSHP
jgi:hypothetical protein